MHKNLIQFIVGFVTGLSLLGCGVVEEELSEVERVLNKEATSPLETAEVAYSIKTRPCNFVIHPGTPSNTINQYSAMVKAGHIVCVKAGSYGGTLRPTRSGGAGNPIIFKAYPGHECVRNRDYNVAPTCKVKLSGIDLDGKSFIRVEGFEVTSNGIVGQDEYNNTSTGLEIINNYVHGNDTGAAIVSRNVKNTTIQRNYIKDTDNTAIAATGNVNNLLIKNNVILHTKGDGIQTSGNNITIQGNVIGNPLRGEHQEGIEVGDGVTGLYILENQIFGYPMNIYLFDADIFVDDEDPIKNVEIIGNTLWCGDYCNAGGVGLGIFAAGRQTPILNLTVADNDLIELWNLFSDDYAEDADAYLSGVVVKNNLCKGSAIKFSLVNKFEASSNVDCY